jgi:plastocyanin
MNKRLPSIWFLATAVAISACGGSSSSTAPASPAASSSTGPSTSQQLLSFDAATKTVKVPLRAGSDIKSGPNFNGYSNGAMAISIPAGWKVTVTCTNTDADYSFHSCAAVADAAATTPLFSGAAVPNPSLGFGGGQTKTFTFTADTAGKYRFACLVGLHEAAGMWDAFNVTASGSPSISFNGTPS